MTNWVPILLAIGFICIWAGYDKLMHGKDEETSMLVYNWLGIVCLIAAGTMELNYIFRVLSECSIQCPLP